MTLRSLARGSAVCLALGSVVAAAAPAQQQCPALKGGELPLKYSGGPTVAAITPCDLMTRLYLFADDSMRGRRAGTDDNARATAYVESEIRRLGLVPAGENGSYFQLLPVVTRGLDTTSTLVVAGTTLKAGTDFLVSTTMLLPADYTGSQLVYGGTLLDTTVSLPASVTDGRLVVFRPAPAGLASDEIQRTPRGQAWVLWYNSLRRATLSTTEQVAPNALRAALNPTATIFLTDQNATLTLSLTPHAADALLGTPLAIAKPGTVGPLFKAQLRFVDTPRLARNVVAMIRGSDPALRGEFVLLGAHTDHLGVVRPINHDSLRVVNMVSRAEGANTHRQTTEDDEYDRIYKAVDSLRKLGRGRSDSIFNGADLGGSGSVSLLEIAEALAKGTVHPNRSVLFVWHTGSDVAAMWGANWFASHPTVARDSIVAMINLDAVGRGEATDEPTMKMDETPIHGSPGFLEVIGAKRLSTEFGKLIETTNATTKSGMTLDYTADATGHPDRMYCRNDQWVYSRYGIPSVFFTTGNHADWREPTDEAQYIQYQHMARVDQFVLASTLAIANLDHRVRVDKPNPDAAAACQQ